MKKVWLMLFWLGCNVCFAETCPTVTDIKQNELKGWMAFDIDEGIPVSPSAVQEFEKNITGFAVAEWMSDAPEGSAHCYYHANTTNYGNVYLVKENLKPVLTNHQWHNLNNDVMQCNVSIAECQFQLSEFKF